MRLAKDRWRCLLRIRPKKRDAVEDALFDRAMASDPGGLRLVWNPTQFSRDQQLRIDPKAHHPSQHLYGGGKTIVLILVPCQKHHQAMSARI